MEDLQQLRPEQHARSLEHAAFDDVAGHLDRPFEQLVAGKDLGEAVRRTVQQEIVECIP